MALTKVYGDAEQQVVALDAVDVTIPATRMTAVMGPTGSGKSTLMHCLAGLDSPTSGYTYLGETALTTPGERALTALRRTTSRQRRCDHRNRPDWVTSWPPN